VIIRLRDVISIYPSKFATKKVMILDKPWIYIVLFGLVLIVYAKIIPKSEAKNGKNGNMLNEVEATMDHFAAELEEQNKALIQMFGDTKKEYELHSARLASRVEVMEKQNARLQGELSRIGVLQEQLEERSLAEAKQTRDTDKPRIADGQTPVFELQDAADPEPSKAPMKIKERYHELLQLHEQGKSIDHIAKKLGMNKGEINLILQLAKKEEASNA
jgi:hypothetical protein